MTTSQQYLPIADITDDIIILKDGGGVLILQTSAVNFGLLSEREQMAIIGAFAQTLNSLSFSIQIVIHSERLNISSYLELLFDAHRSQTNPLLASMIANYIEFIQTTVKENDVLDKKFYIAIPLYSIELGIIATKENLQQKLKTVLYPRRDQIIRQLKRVGLKSIQLVGIELLSLFYDIYNGLPTEITLPEPLKLNKPSEGYPSPLLPIIKTAPADQAAQPVNNNPAIVNPQPVTSQPSKNHPFVVEELKDEDV